MVYREIGVHTQRYRGSIPDVLLRSSAHYALLSLSYLTLIISSEYNRRYTMGPKGILETGYNFGVEQVSIPLCWVKV